MSASTHISGGGQGSLAKAIEQEDTTVPVFVHRFVLHASSLEIICQLLVPGLGRVTAYLRTFKLTGAKSERAETFRNLRGSNRGVSGCTTGDNASLISLSVMLRKRAYVSMCLSAVGPPSNSVLCNRPVCNAKDARFVDIVHVQEFPESLCALTGR